MTTMRTLPLFLLLLATSCASHDSTLAAAPDLLITHATVIDVRDGSLHPNTTVLIRGDRIEQVTAESFSPDARTIVDAEGRFVIPGLWDMHAHTRDDHYARTLNFPLQVASGITGIRLMAGDCIGSCGGSTRIEDVRRWRAEKAAGTLLAPRIVAASPLLDGPGGLQGSSYVIETPEEARAAVHLFKDRGVDFLKVYSMLPRDAFFALAAEARRVGIAFGGHLPLGVTAAEASDAGMKSLEHMHGLQEGCSSIERELVDEQKTLNADEIGRTGKPHPMMIYLKQAGRAFAHYDEKKCHALYDKFVRNGTWMSPTLYTYEDMLLTESESGRAQLRGNPYFRYIPAPLIRRDEAAPASNAMVADADALRLRRFGEMLADMQHHGVGIIAGSDAGGSSYHYPGYGLHESLVLEVRGGLTPLEALQTATLNAARYFGTTATMGTVEAGKVADLVILDGNPLVDIHNTQHVHAVVLAGNYLSRATLDAMLDRVAAEADRTRHSAAGER
jgi:hypothetical protein